MKEKKVVVNDREFNIKELLYKDILEVSDLDKSEVSKKLLTLSTGITEDEYNSLTIKEGIELQKAVNELNGLSDFQDPLQKKE